MRETVRALVKQGRLELLDEIELPEGEEVTVTIDFENDGHALLKLAEQSFAFWDNPDDAVYDNL